MLGRRNGQEQQKAEEQRRLQDERRRSAERRAAAVGGTAPRYSQASSQYTPEFQQSQFDDRRSGGAPVAGSDVLGQPTSRSSQVYPDARTRGPNIPQQEPSRPSQATSGATRRTQAAPRQPTAASASAGPSSQQRQPEGAQQRTGTSSFPHAFQRWEDLSSHWEGLTSYWIHKLEQNTEEIRDTVPNSVTLNRQITDLSAAGANLFHAVVELQRLRASSERKFQRWFFESKDTEERWKEQKNQMEQQLELERGSRESTARQRAETSIEVANVTRQMDEMKRELMIPKEEARRAWEELGRRNQESLETAQSLKDGRVTLVGGVQVVPYFGGPSRTGSSQRPGTRDGQPQYGSTGMASAAGAAGLQSPGDEREYYPQEGSPTNTDPFMESTPQVKPLYHDSGQQSLAAGTYQPSASSSSAQQRAAAASSAQPRVPPPGGSIPVTTQEAQRFYQHAPQQTFLHSPQSSTQGIPTAAGAAQSAPPVNREEVRSEGSYVDTMSEGEPEYGYEASGNYPTDDQSRPIVFRSRVQSNETDDSYDTEADIRREEELTARYGGGSLLPEPPSVPSTSAQAMQHYSPTSSNTGGGAQSRPDYEGGGYSGGPSWDQLQTTRHHHPTRLSDVLEEEEERE